MPKTKDKRRKSRGEEDYEEEPSQSSSQPSQNQRKRRAAEDNEEESNTQGGKGSQKSKTQQSSTVLDRKVIDETVRYILFSDTNKEAVKKADITKNVLKEHAKHFPVVIKEAEKIFKKLFGFQLEEIEIGASHTKAYILINILEQQEDDDFICWGDDEPKMGLLMVILSLIFMSDNVLTEENLWHSLKRLGIEPKKKHEIFGDPEKLINQEMVKQLFLERKKITGGEVVTHEYRWGARSYKEISKRKVLEFVTQIYGNGTEMKMWGNQYRQVLEEESVEQN